MSGGGGSRQTTQTMKQEPWAPAQPHLRRGMRQAESLAEQQTQQGVPGFDPLQTSAQRQMLDVARRSPGQGTVDLATQAHQAALGGVDGEAFQRRFDAITNPVQRQFSEEVLPQISDQFTQTGQPGSTRQGVAEGIAARGLGEELTRVGAELERDETQRQMQAMRMAPQMQRLQQQQAMLSPEILSQIGQARRGLELEQKEDPWRQLQRYQQLVQGIGGMGGITEQPGPIQPSAGQRALGGAATGAGAMAATGNPYLIGGGAGVGALGAMF